MKYLLLLSLLCLPAFAQESNDETSTITEESMEKKQQKLPLPENAEERKQKQEEEAELGPYDREGNYRIKLKPKDSDLPTD